MFSSAMSFSREVISDSSQIPGTASDIAIVEIIVRFCGVLSCHSRESGNPVRKSRCGGRLEHRFGSFWIPACAGMTRSQLRLLSLARIPSPDATDINFDNSYKSHYDPSVQFISQTERRYFIVPLGRQNKIPPPCVQIAPSRLERPSHTSGAALPCP